MQERQRKALYNNNKGINKKNDNTCVNIYAPNRGTSKYIKQILRYKEKNWHEYNDSRRLSHSTGINRNFVQTENQ